VSALTAKGLYQATGKPDVYVTFLTQETQYVYARNNGWWGGQPEQYRQGTLAIHFVDPSTGDGVWQGRATGALSENPSPEGSAESMNKAVSRILASFPPK